MTKWWKTYKFDCGLTARELTEQVYENKNLFL